MFITKQERAKKKMREDFQKVDIDPIEFGRMTTFEEIEKTFQEMCNEEAKKLEAKVIGHSTKKRKSPSDSTQHQESTVTRSKTAISVERFKTMRTIEGENAQRRSPSIRNTKIMATESVSSSFDVETY